MTIRLLGLTDEQRLEFEQATGIKTEAAQIIIEQSVQQAEALITDALREVQTVVGPHGSVSRLQAGGVKITAGGIGIYTDGVLKTTIDQDGNLFVGSAIESPSTTSLCVFVNEQFYQGETMGEGDLLIGDNSAANVLYDASAHQLKFRNGTTVNVYIDTDGTLKAGAGVVKLDANGIAITVSTAIGDLNAYTFDTNGGVLVGGFYGWSNPGGEDGVLVQTQSPSGGYGKILVESNGTSIGLIDLYSTTPIGQTPEIQITSVNVGQSSIVMNANLSNVDTSIRGDNDTNLLYADASTDMIGIGKKNPSYKLDVTGEVNVSDAFNVGGVDIAGATQEQIEDITGAMVSGNTETGIAVTYDDATGKLNFDAQTAGDARYAPIAKGVTNGDTHDHDGGDGAQIVHNSLANIGSNTHASIDTHIASTSVHVTNGDTHDHVGGDGGLLDQYISFATYVDLNPMTATGKVPYAVTIRASMSVLSEFSVACFTAGAAHSTSNYYSIALVLRQSSGDTTIATVDTKTLGSGIAGSKVFSTTTISPSSVTGTGYFYISVTKTGTPADTYMVSPVLKYKH